MFNLDEELELLRQKHQQQGFTLESQPENQPYTNVNDIPTLLGAAGLGAGNMVNNTVLGGLGQVLGTIGAGVEWISPFSGGQDEKVAELMRLGVPYEEATAIYPYQDSWITSAAKGTLEAQNAVSDTLGGWRQQLLGDNPTFEAGVAEGVGSSLGFAATGLLGKAKTGSTLAGALLSGLTEALSESGGTMGEAYKQGMYDEGLTTANKSLAANALLNTALNASFGRFAPHTDKIRNPYTRFGVQTAEEVLNELIQEPSQQTIEKAANRDLFNGEDFIPALTDEAGNWWQTAKDLAPSVATSTLITQALMGGAAMADPGIRQDVQDAYRNRNFDREEQEGLLKNEMDKRARLQKRLDNELARGERTDQRIVDNLNTRIKKADSNIQTFSDHLKPYISDYEAPEAFTGKFEHVKASDASQADTRFRLIEADDLITSHNELGGINEAYPQEWQIRDRTSQGSMQEVGDIAQKLDPPQLGSSYLAANCSPIVTKNGVVVSGNGRTLALREAYKNYADNANSYKKYLIDHAKDFDIDPHEVSRMAKPVLVRELVGNDLDIEKFANDSNVSTIAEKRTSERAISDAEAISPQMLNTYSSDHDWDNFKMQFLANLPGNEAASLKQANGSLNKTGEVRLINALIGKAYGRDAIVGKLTEATDDISKNVSEALARTAPDVAVFEEAARAEGGIRPELSVASDIAEAALHLDKIRGDKGTNVATDNAQVYMEGLGISPEARLWLNYFDANKGSVPKISQGINNYIQLAKQQRLEGQGSLFGDEIDRSKLDLMREALGFSEEQVQGITQSREADTQGAEVFPIKQRTGRVKNSIENADTSQTFGQPPLNDNVDLDSRVKTVKISHSMPDVPFYNRIKAFGKDRQNEIVRRFDNGSVVNQHTGLIFTLSRQGLNHILDSARNNDNIGGEVVYEAVPYLDSLARNAYRVEIHKDLKPSKTKIEGQLGNLRHVHRFLVPVELDGNNHILKLTAKEFEDGMAEVTDVSLYDMKYTKKLSAHPSQNSPNLMGRAAGTIGSADTVSVRDMLYGVNDSQGNPYLNQTLDDNVDRETEQVKSATENNGNFGITEDSIFGQESVDSTKNNGDAEENSNAQYDGFIGSIDVDHFGQSRSINIFADEHNGSDYLDITDENGNSVATYDIGRKTFAIRPEHSQEGWVRRIQDALKSDLGKNPEAEITRRIFKEKAINAGQSETLAENLSRVYNAVNNFTARWSGLSPLQIAKLDNLSILKSDRSPTGRRGETQVIEQQLDDNGNVIQEAQTIIRLFQNADKSTLLHETGHIFLERLKKLANSGLLKGDRNRARLDWGTILREYGLQKIDFSKELTGKNKELWINANEQFASGLERYFMKGKAPTTGLQKVFETFKGWLKDIYGSLKGIQYTDAKGVRRDFSLSRDIQGVFDDMLGGHGNIQNSNNTAQNQQNQQNQKTVPTPTLTEAKNQLENKLNLDRQNNQNEQSVQETGKSENSPASGTRGNILQRLISVAGKGVKSLFNIAHVARKPARPDTVDFSFLSNLEAEKRFRAAENVNLKQGIIPRIRQHAHQLIRSFKGDYSELSEAPNAKERGLLEAKGWFEKNNRSKQKAVQDTYARIDRPLRALNKEQRHLLNAYAVLADLNWDVQENPDGDLPFGLTPDDVRREFPRAEQLARKDKVVWDTMQELDKNRKELTDKYITHAALLGIDMSETLRRPNYFRHKVIEYAQLSSTRGIAPSAKGNVEIEGLGAEMASRGWLKRRKGSTLDIIADYQQANAEVQMQMAQDIETMKLLLQLKKEFDIMPKIVEQMRKTNGFKSQSQTSKQGTISFSQAENENEIETIVNNVPDDHAVFIPSASRLIEGNKSSYTNLLLMAGEDIAQEKGIPLDRIFEVLGADEDELKKGMLVLPKEIVSVLRRMAQDRKRGALGKIAKDLTTFWKKSVLFTPFRNLKYNFRNFTGDIDALIAGNPHALKYLPQAVQELTGYFVKGGKDSYTASQDLQDYIDRTGGSGIPSLNLSARDAQQLLDFLPIKEPGEKAKQKTIDKYNEKVQARDARIRARLNGETDENIGNAKKVWNKTTEVAKKLGKTKVGDAVKAAFGLEVGFTEWREHLLRYAAYLDYLEQMKNNKDGKPNNWGASIEDEVMAVKDIKDRAYKMSNELLGAYEQISEVGKQLRDMLVPFYSWMEVNAKRYYRLIKNAHKRGKTAYATKQLILGKAAAMPFYAASTSMSVAKILAFTALTQLFNRAVCPDADDDLPDDVKYRPHLTFGNHGGDVYYFDRIGALADIADWVSLDSVFLDVKDIMSGQQTIGGYLKKMIQAPVSKAINGLNPGLKMPIELAMGRSMFPDVFHPSTIRDPMKYIASSFGLTYPYKLLTREPHSTKQEITNFLLYSKNPDEAAYWQTLDKVRQFQNNVLDKHFDGFATTKRGTILRNLKTALRYDDKDAVRRYLKEYAQADGTKQGLKASMKAMNPLHGLSEKEKKQFLKWLTPNDKKYLRKAQRYFHQLADKYIR